MYIHRVVVVVGGSRHGFLVGEGGRDFAVTRTRVLLFSLQGGPGVADRDANKRMTPTPNACAMRLGAHTSRPSFDCYLGNPCPYQIPPIRR